MGSADAITTAAQAGAWLEGLINHERMASFRAARLDLAPIEALMDRLGRPDQGLSILHVAGSKGKGSVCLLAEAMLGAMGGGKPGELNAESQRLYDECCLKWDMMNGTA